MASCFAGEVGECGEPGDYIPHGEKYRAQLVRQVRDGSTSEAPAGTSYIGGWVFGHLR